MALHNCPRCGWRDDAMTVTEAAALLSVSDQTVRNRIAEGRLPGTAKSKVPGSYKGEAYMIPAEAVRVELKRQKITDAPAS